MDDVNRPFDCLIFVWMLSGNEITYTAVNYDRGGVIYQPQHAFYKKRKCESRFKKLQKVPATVV